MPGYIVFAPQIRRSHLKFYRDILFVFGDNMLGIGFGGQAKYMRGEPNAVGIPTKWKPNNDVESFFYDNKINGDAFLVHNSQVKRTIDFRFYTLAQHLFRDGIVVWPSAGIGTGMSRLETTSPTTLQYINEKLKFLQEIVKR